MFVIHTAQRGEAWHTLQPILRLGHAVPSMGFDCELEVAVRVDYGDPDGPYLFKFWLNDSFTGDSNEVVSREEYQQRIAAAEEHGESYIGTARPFSEDSSLYTYCTKLRDHFLALMALDLFKLPVSM